MVVEYYDGDKLSTRINADYVNNKVTIENYTDDLVSIKDFEEFLESRCFPRTRDKVKLILKDMELDFYDPYLICKKTEGQMAEDHMWLKFLDE